MCFLLHKKHSQSWFFKYLNSCIVYIQLAVFFFPDSVGALLRFLVNYSHLWTSGIGWNHWQNCVSVQVRVHETNKMGTHSKKCFVELLELRNSTEPLRQLDKAQRVCLGERIRHSDHPQHCNKNIPCGPKGIFFIVDYQYREQNCKQRSNFIFCIMKF